ncbi:MAG: hypothetical protein R6W68_03675 [Ignavibacteriaceae bacterium]
MFKSFFSVLIIVTFFYLNSLAQEANSIQLNGGIISPMSSSNGLTTSLQYSHSIDSNISLYVYSGYASWDKHYVIYKEDLTLVQKKQHFRTYSSDGHILIPVYFGSRIDLHTNKLFTSYVNLEIGYSYLSYSSYNHWKSINPETGEVLSYSPDPFTKKEIVENIFAFGIGVGLSHPVTDNVNLIFTLKLNSNLSSNHSSLFGSRATYTILATGFNVKI